MVKEDNIYYLNLDLPVGRQVWEGLRIKKEKFINPGIGPGIA